jgi:hypothetical protein
VRAKFKKHTIVVDTRNKENGEGRVTQSSPFGMWVLFRDGHYWYAYNNLESLSVSSRQLSWAKKLKLNISDLLKSLSKSLNR